MGKVDDLLLNVWGNNSNKSIKAMKSAIKLIISEYLISRELDEALTAIQELNIPNFHHEIIKQLIPLVADYYVAKDLVVEQQTKDSLNAADLQRLAIPKEINDKAMQIQLAVDLISTALEHNIMAIAQVRGGFERLRERMSDYKLDCPLFDKYYDCIAAQFAQIINSKMESNDEQKESKVKKLGGARDRIIDDEIKHIILKSRQLVLAHAKKQGIDLKVDCYEGIACKTQTVAGINYFIKICVAEKKYIHVVVWRKLDQSMEVLEVIDGQTLSDPLVFGRKKVEEVKPPKRVMCAPPGGLNNRKVDDPFIVNACERIRDRVCAHSSKAESIVFKEFVPIKAKSQVVAGTNLFVKVRVDKGKFIHIRVWCKLDQSFELSAVQWGKEESDEIVYF